MDQVVTWGQLAWVMGILSAVVVLFVGIIARVVVIMVVRAENRVASAIESLNSTVAALKEDLAGTRDSMLQTRAANTYVHDVEERIRGDHNRLREEVNARIQALVVGKKQQPIAGG